MDSASLVDAPSRLLSRVLVTWLELTVVGTTGGAIGATIGGPPGFIAYLATTLLSVGIVLYNVNELVKGWLRATGVVDESVANDVTDTDEE